MRKTLLYIATVLLGSVATSCSQSGRAASDGESYAVSIEPQRWILEQLVSPQAHITTMLRSGADPESYEPSIGLRAEADRAALYFATGSLPFEDALRQSLTAPVTDTSAGVDFIYGTHHHDHGHGDESHGDEGLPDPHYWTSVSGALTMARNMARALSEQNPDSAGVYGERLAALTAQLDSLDRGIKARVASAPVRAFAIWHPSLSYFARDYDLEQVPVGMENKEMSARQLREVIDHARGDSIRVFFFQKEYDRRQAETINEAIGSRIVTVDPLAYEWDEQMMLIADELARP